MAIEKTISTKFSGDFYIGIDVSKLTLDVSVIDENEKQIISFKVKNSPKGFDELWKKVSGNGLKKSCLIKLKFCLEATGIYSDAIVTDLLNRKAFVSVLNPSSSAAFLKAHLRRSKTDKMDAHGLALYALKMKPGLYKQPPEHIRNLRKETRFLQSLIAKKTQLVREKEALSQTHKAIHDELTAVLLGKIKDQKSVIKNLVLENPQLLKNVQHLTSIPGIGDQSAWVLLGEILYDADSQLPLGPKQQVAHSGLSPREIQSGSSVFAAPRICKTGNRVLRQALFFPALTAISRCDSIAATYRRLVKTGKKKKVALIACMRKLLCLAVALLQKQMDFVPGFVSTRNPQEVVPTA